MVLNSGVTKKVDMQKLCVRKYESNVAVVHVFGGGWFTVWTNQREGSLLLLQKAEGVGHF